MVDANKSASDIFLDYNVEIPPLPASQTNWVYGLNQFERIDVAICPATFRPFYHPNEDKYDWEDSAEKAFGIRVYRNQAKIFNGNRYFESFILKYRRQPNYQ